jgi:hypothetical protein
MTYTRPVYCRLCQVHVEDRPCAWQMAGRPMLGLCPKHIELFKKALKESNPKTLEELDAALDEAAGEGDDDTDS